MYVCIRTRRNIDIYCSGFKLIFEHLYHAKETIVIYRSTSCPRKSMVININLLPGPFRWFVINGNKWQCKNGYKWQRNKW